MLFLDHSHNVFNIDKNLLNTEAVLLKALIKAQSNGLFIIDDEIVSVDICSNGDIQIWGRDLTVALFPVEESDKEDIDGIEIKNIK